jgi:hypothetical protein
MVNIKCALLHDVFITGREKTSMILTNRQFYYTPRGEGPPILANLAGNLGILY